MYSSSSSNNTWKASASPFEQSYVGNHIPALIRPLGGEFGRWLKVPSGDPIGLSCKETKDNDAGTAIVDMEDNDFLAHECYHFTIPDLIFRYQNVTSESVAKSSGRIRAANYNKSDSKNVKITNDLPSDLDFAKSVATHFNLPKNSVWISASSSFPFVLNHAIERCPTRRYVTADPGELLVISTKAIQKRIASLCSIRPGPHQPKKELHMKQFSGTYPNICHLHPLCMELLIFGEIPADAIVFRVNFGRAIAQMSVPLFFGPSILVPKSFQDHPNARSQYIMKEVHSKLIRRMVNKRRYVAEDLDELFLLFRSNTQSWMRNGKKSLTEQEVVLKILEAVTEHAQPPSDSREGDAYQILKDGMKRLVHNLQAHDDASHEAFHFTGSLFKKMTHSSESGIHAPSGSGSQAPSSQGDSKKNQKREKGKATK